MSAIMATHPMPITVLRRTGIMGIRLIATMLIRLMATTLTLNTIVQPTTTLNLTIELDYLADEFTTIENPALLCIGDNRDMLVIAFICDRAN